MKRFLLVSLVLLLLASSVAPAMSATITKTLPVAQVKKAKSAWCWAACCEMLIKYFKGTADQFKVAKYTYGDYRNDGANTEQYNSAIDNYENKGVAGKVIAGGLSWAAVQHQIGNGYPILAFRIRHSTADAHFTVVRGYTTSGQQVWYNEPDTGGNQWIAYSQFFDDGNGYWDATVYYK